MNRRFKVAGLVAVSGLLVAGAVFGGVSSTSQESSGGSTKTAGAKASAAPPLASLTKRDLQITMSVGECSNKAKPGKPPYMTLLQWDVQLRPLLQKYIVQGNDGRYFYGGAEAANRKRIDVTVERTLIGADGSPQGSPQLIKATSDWMSITGGMSLSGGGTTSPAGGSTSPSSESGVKPGDIVRYRLSINGTSLKTSYVYDKVDGSPYAHEDCQAMRHVDSIYPATDRVFPRPEAWKRP